MTKSQLFENMIITNKYENFVTVGCNNVKEVKDNLVHYANMYYCLKKQCYKAVGYYLGESYMLSESKIDSTIDAIHSVAGKLGYVVYSPNGAWFIKSK